MSGPPADYAEAQGAGGIEAHDAVEVEVDEYTHPASDAENGDYDCEGAFCEEYEHGEVGGAGGGARGVEGVYWDEG